MRGRPEGKGPAGGGAYGAPAAVPAAGPRSRGRTRAHYVVCGDGRERACERFARRRAEAHRSRRPESRCGIMPLVQPPGGFRTGAAARVGDRNLIAFDHTGPAKGSRSARRSFAGDGDFSRGALSFPGYAVESVRVVHSPRSTRRRVVASSRSMRLAATSKVNASHSGPSWAGSMPFSFRNTIHAPSATRLFPSTNGWLRHR